MPRRKSNITKEKIAKSIKEGRGQEEKEKYYSNHKASMRAD